MGEPLLTRLSMYATLILIIYKNIHYLVLNHISDFNTILNSFRGFFFSFISVSVTAFSTHSAQLPIQQLFADNRWKFLLCSSHYQGYETLYNKCLGGKKFHWHQNGKKIFEKHEGLWENTQEAKYLKFNSRQIKQLKLNIVLSKLT